MMNPTIEVASGNAGQGDVHNETFPYGHQGADDQHHDGQMVMIARAGPSHRTRL